MREISMTYYPVSESPNVVLIQEVCVNIETRAPLLF